MTFRVFQHWDPLRVCVVGRCYPPDFFSWITNTRARNLFEQIAQETEEDLQKIIQKLRSFEVQILRPEIPNPTLINGTYPKPPITPRDYMVMIGTTFYESWSTNFNEYNYRDIKDPSWPECSTWDEFNRLPTHIQEECKTVFGLGLLQTKRSEYDKIIEIIRQKGNIVKSGNNCINGAMVARIGKDLFFGTNSYDQDLEKTKNMIDREFLTTRNHVVNTGGHSDGTYCPVCPGLIISTHDIDSYKHTFPGWEVIYLNRRSLESHKPFSTLQLKNQGRWWIPGFEYNNSVIDIVERYLKTWVGNVIETVFDVNMLIIDPKNVIVFNENEILFNAFKRYGITPHIITFRHRHFWDGGIHCFTTDLDRSGKLKDFFPEQI